MGRPSRCAPATGSPTDRRRQPHGTYLTATLDAGALRDVVLHPVPR